MSGGKDLESRVALLEKQMAELLRDKFVGSFPKRCKYAGEAWELKEQADDVEPGFYCKHCLSEKEKFVKLSVERKDIPGGFAGYKIVICPECHRNLEVQ